MLKVAEVTDIIVVFSCLILCLVHNVTSDMESVQSMSQEPSLGSHTGESEPSYMNLVYGGIWKHVIVRPQETEDGIRKAKEFAISFIKSRSASETAIEPSKAECVTKLDLWYSTSNQEPFAMNMVTGKSHPNPVSVPFSFGSLYNFHIVTKGSVPESHFVTLTTVPEDASTFVYSHNYRPLDGDHRASSLTTDCLEESPSDSLVSPPLSMLVENKELKSWYKDPPLKEIQHKVSVSVMTYNIWNYFTNSKHASSYEERISRLIKLVKSQKPDIIGFQEIRLEMVRGGRLGPSQMDHLSSGLKGYQFVFQPAMMQGNCLEAGRNEEGVGIFSKYPILYHEYILLYRNLSAPADGHQRICLHAVISVPGAGEVHVFNTHWSLEERAREKAATQILEFMKQFKAPALLLGDFNAKPHEDSISILTESLTDAWASLHGDEDGFTYNALKEKLSDRIDYIMFAKKKRFHLKSINVVPDKTGSLAASDHRPLLAEFTLNPDTS